MTTPKTFPTRTVTTSTGKRIELKVYRPNARPVPETRELLERHGLYAVYLGERHGHTHWQVCKDPGAVEVVALIVNRGLHSWALGYAAGWSAATNV